MAYWNQSFGGAIVKVKVKVKHEHEHEHRASQPHEDFTRIFNHCRLEWDSKYLDYHTVGAAAGAASAAPVRQPIDSCSVEK